MSQSVTHTMLPRIGDGSMNKLIDLIERALNRLEALPFNNTKTLAPVAFTALVTQRVFHGLGYPVTGVVQISATTPTSVAVSSTPDPDPNNFILLGVDTTSIVTLAVF